MRHCEKCILPETFPGIDFNPAGICHFCREFTGIENLEPKKAECEKKFEALLQVHRGQSSYDVLMCFSGGKDSTYTLGILRKKYGLNILALTMDNGFLPEQTFKNIRRVVEYLGIDHILFKPDFQVLKKIFKECAQGSIYPAKTLERASSICTSCMGVVKFSALRLALEKNIPLLAFGWSPGQAPITSAIMKNNAQMVKSMQKILFEPLRKIVGDKIKPYFLEDRHFQGSYQYPYNVNPLAFWEYDEKKIYQEISQWGWEAPRDTDANSTNCQLNSLGIAVHKRQYGYNPYVFELAKLVREGHMSRAQALDRISEPENQQIISEVRKRLGL